MRRRGFTLIEVMVVITIIIMLAGMGMAGAMLVRTAARKSVSEKNLSIISLAVAQYLGEYGAMAASAGISDGGNADLATTLLTERKGVALLDRSGGMVDTSGALIDGFRQKVRWCAVTVTAFGRLHTKAVVLASAAGTPDATGDDLVLYLDVAAGEWKRITYAAIPDATWVPR